MVVVLGMGSLEVEPIAGIPQEPTVWVSEEMCPLAETKVISKVGWRNLAFDGKNQFHTMVERE